MDARARVSVYGLKDYNARQKHGLKKGQNRKCPRQNKILHILHPEARFIFFDIFYYSALFINP